MAARRAAEALGICFAQAWPPTGLPHARLEASAYSGGCVGPRASRTRCAWRRNRTPSRSGAIVASVVGVVVVRSWPTRRQR